jgi:hypothetical protein
MTKGSNDFSDNICFARVRNSTEWGTSALAIQIGEVSGHSPPDGQ